MKTRHTIPILAILLAALLVACASIGNPDGGAYDETPPRVLSALPADRSVMNRRKKVSIYFDEFIKLQNANEKVVVSPPQIEAANVRADGKRIKIDLYDSLQANTTYTIDFSDAIEDNNEGNPMGQYTYSFSTGETIDTMEISGYVLNAADLEPVKGIMVGLYPADSTFHDSIFRTKPFSRVSRTNGSGRFCIKGVKPGKYKAYALTDADGNFIFNQKSEQIAFDTLVLQTGSRPDVRMDTIWRDSTHYDSIRVIPYTHYFPDDVLLTAFLEDGQDHHLLKTERPSPEIFKLFFTSPADSLPHIEGLNFDASCLVVEPSQHNDTITYWVTDTIYTHLQDTLALALTFLDTDTLGQLVPHTDTLELVPKVTWEKILREKQKQIDEWNKAREKRAKKAKEPLPPEENPYEKTYLQFSLKPGTTIGPHQNIRFIANEPFLKVDTASLHFYEKKDSDLLPRPFLFLPVEGDKRSYMLYAEWEPKTTYVFQADSAAFVSVLGSSSKPLKNEIKVRALEDYGAIFVHALLPDTGFVIQLLGRNDKPIVEKRADADGRADFFYLQPAEYFIRGYIDRNGNGKWDTGNYNLGLQPEEVFYFPKSLMLKAQWDMEQDWDVRGIARHLQKPAAITKQKPDKEKNIRKRNEEREAEKRNAKNRQRGTSR